MGSRGILTRSSWSMGSKPFWTWYGLLHHLFRSTSMMWETYLYVCSSRWIRKAQRSLSSRPLPRWCLAWTMVCSSKWNLVPSPPFLLSAITFKTQELRIFYVIPRHGLHEQKKKLRTQNHSWPSERPCLPIPTIEPSYMQLNSFPTTWSPKGELTFVHLFYIVQIIL